MARHATSRTLAALLMALSTTCAVAQAADDQPYDTRVRQLAESFRCLVCQNQTLADSNAELAADLREQIRNQVRHGASDEQVRAWMVRRYGDFVLYQPPVKPVTWALWSGPFVTLAIGAVVLIRNVRRARHLRPRSLSPDERRHADALLADGNEGPRR